MKDSEIQKRLSLIADLAEDAQAGIEAMIVPFLVYGLAVPAGTALSYYLGSIGLGRFIWILWFTLIGSCQLFLIFYHRSISAEKIQRASDRIFAALWGSTGAVIVLSFVFATIGTLTFTVAFFIIGILLAVACITSGTIIQKKGRLLLYAIGSGWTVSAVCCLFVNARSATLIIAAATFLLFAVPAFAVLLGTQKKKRAANGQP